MATASIASSICLIAPPSPKDYRKAESLGLRYLCSAIAKNANKFILIDAHAWNLSVEQVVEELPECVFFGIQVTFSEQIAAALFIVDQIKFKYPQAVIVFGGHVVSFAPEFFLFSSRKIDLCIVGEAESSILDLFNISRNTLAEGEWRQKISSAVFLSNDKIIKTSPAMPLILDEIPFPHRDLRDYQKYNLASVITSRGCFFRCNFCSVPGFSELSSSLKFRTRDIENILDEITYLYRELNVDHISFIDDIFINKSENSKRRAIALCEGLKRRKLKILFSIECRSDGVHKETFTVLRDNGLRRVFLGVESGSNDSLDYFQKDLRVIDHITALDTLDELHIPVACGLILFHPVCDKEQIVDTLKFMTTKRKLKARHLRTRMAIYPGTPVYNSMKQPDELASPEPLNYKLSDELEYLYDLYDALAKTLSYIDNQFNLCQFRIASYKSREYCDAFQSLQEIEGEYATYLFDISSQLINDCSISLSSMLTAADHTNQHAKIVAALQQL